MSTNTNSATVPTKSDARTGLLPGVGHFALDVLDRGQATTLGVLHDARTELRTAVDHGIDLADKVAAATFRFAKKVVQRVDDAAAETLSGAERVLGNALRSARETTRAAGELAATAAHGVTGTRGGDHARA